MPIRKHITDGTYVSATSATPVGADTILFLDATDSLIKKGLVSDLPAPTGDTTTYKTTADQTVTWDTTMQNVTGLSFTPVANTTYRIEVFCRWINSAPTTNGAIFGHNNISTLSCPYVNGFAYAQDSATAASVTNPLRANSVRTVTSTACNADGQMFKMDLLFRTGASPTGDFIFQASPENATGTITIAKGAVMIVQVLAN